MASNEEAEGCMNMLWQKLEKLYGKWMAKTCSGSYQAIQDGFMSKWLYRIVAGVLNYWNWVITLACLLGSHLRLLYCCWTCWHNAILKRTLWSLWRGKQDTPIIAEHQQVLPKTKGALLVLWVLLEGSNWKCHFLEKETGGGWNKACNQG